MKICGPALFLCLSAGFHLGLFALAAFVAVPLRTLSAPARLRLVTVEVPGAPSPRAPGPRERGKRPRRREAKAPGGSRGRKEPVAIGTRRGRGREKSAGKPSRSRGSLGKDAGGGPVLMRASSSLPAPVASPAVAAKAPEIAAKPALQGAPSFSPAVFSPVSTPAAARPEKKNDFSRPPQPDFPEARISPPSSEADSVSPPAVLSRTGSGSPGRKKNPSRPAGIESSLPGELPPGTGLGALPLPLSLPSAEGRTGSPGRAASPGPPAPDSNRAPGGAGTAPGGGRGAKGGKISGGAGSSGAGAFVPAQVVALQKPVYPQESRRGSLGEQGTVIVAVTVEADGKPGRIRIVRSSGYFRLDRAAVAALEHAAFLPATRGGKPVPSEKKLAFMFRLEDGP